MGVSDFAFFELLPFEPSDHRMLGCWGLKEWHYMSLAVLPFRRPISYWYHSQQQPRRIWLLHLVDFSTDIWVAVILQEEGRSVLLLARNIGFHAFLRQLRKVGEIPNINHGWNCNSRNIFRSLLIHGRAWSHCKRFLCGCPNANQRWSICQSLHRKKGLWESETVQTTCPDLLDAKRHETKVHSFCGVLGDTNSIALDACQLQHESLHACSLDRNILLETPLVSLRIHFWDLKSGIAVLKGWSQATYQITINEDVFHTIFIHSIFLHTQVQMTVTGARLRFGM